MDLTSFNEFISDPISLSEDHEAKPLPHVLKDFTYFKITPNEVAYTTSSKWSYSMHNLDIITLPSQSYLSVECSITYNDGTTGNQDHQDMSGTATEDDHFALAGIPSTAGWIGGYTYSINDQKICMQNNDLARSLYAVNGGIFSPENRANTFTGMADPGEILFDQIYKDNGCIELIVPLKYVIPFFRQDKALWGVKQQLEITKANLADIFYRKLKVNSTAVLNNYTIDSFTINSAVWYMPFVKVSDPLFSELVPKYYNNTISRYWLDNESFLSDIYSNTTSHTDLVYRITSKGLNHQPRFLLIHAVAADTSNTTNNTYEPLGFSGKSTAAQNDNQIVFTNLRIRMNGIYVDGGDVWSPSASAVSANNPSPLANQKGYWIQYLEYVKFLGGLNDKDRPSPLPFQEWLKNQVYVIDLVNKVDIDSIFLNSSSSVVIELEFSTLQGSVAANTSFRINATLLYDKLLEIQHSNNTAVIRVN